MKQNAIILTDGKLAKIYGKTAHGLITGASRYAIQAVVDHKHAGSDAGYVIDKKIRNIPIYDCVKSAMEELNPKPTHCIIGIATSGGYITLSLEKCLEVAIQYKLCIVNGLHEAVSEHPRLKPLLEKYQTDVIEIRKPKGFKELHAWKGRLQHLKTPRIAILGTDCAIGKRTTAQKLYQLCQEKGLPTEMIYTGQTGWLQGFNYGFIFDSTLNDFVSGELEHAIISCVKEKNPELILLEGQSALRNPSGPCGAEFICSAGAKGVILQHPIGRTYYQHGEGIFYPLPSIQDEIKLIELYGAKVLAVTLNTHSLQENWEETKVRVENEVGVPVFCPREEDLNGLYFLVQKYIQDCR